MRPDNWKKNVADVSSRADGLSGNLQRERETLELIIGEYERTLNIQMWKNYADVFTVILQTPSGQKIIVQPDKNGRQDVLTNGTEVLVYAGQPSPYSVWQEIFFDLLPRDRYIESGIWTFHLIPEKSCSAAISCIYRPSRAVLQIRGLYGPIRF